MNNFFYCQCAYRDSTSIDWSHLYDEKSYEKALMFKTEYIFYMLSLHAVQLSSLKTEMERIQAQKDQLQADLLASRTELDALRVALSHLQSTNKTLSDEKVAFLGPADLSTSACHLYRSQCLKRPRRIN